MHPINFEVPRIIAHRGAKFFAPENTLAAFFMAKELGFSWVEFDVMLTHDQVVVVIHDENLKRTTNGSGDVIQRSYDYIKTLDAGSWFDRRFANERVSTLSEVLDFLYQNQLAANIEIKVLPGYEQAIVEQLLVILQNAKMTKPPLISSFNHHVLSVLRDADSHIQLGFLMDHWLPNWETECDKLQCVSVNTNYAILNSARVASIKASGRKLLSYTVNQIDRAIELFSWGVDSIFSDCPPAIVDFNHSYKS